MKNKCISKKLKEKNGSATVVLAIVFSSMAIMILSTIAIARELVVKSECSSFGAAWSRAILSEYDIYLLKDYGIMAYRGAEFDVDRTLNKYIEYSMTGKLDAMITGVKSNLSHYSLSEPENFKRAMKHSIVYSSIKKKGRRKKREYDPNKGINDTPGYKMNDDNGQLKDIGKVIRNKVVLDTMQSQGQKSGINLSDIRDIIKEDKSPEAFIEKGSAAAIETAFMKMYMSSHLAIPNNKKRYLENEWEYILNGSPNDLENLKAARRKIFLLRNAANILYLKKDSRKSALIKSVAEILTPEASALTEIVITEAWAAAESEVDITDLLDNKRVPIMKTEVTWRTDLKKALSNHLMNRLKKDVKKTFDKNLKKLDKSMKEGHGNVNLSEKGLEYEDYLIVLMLSMNEKTKLLRMMDIVQIDMKSRYYEDFLLDEYNTGVYFSIKADGRDYEFEDEYK